LDWEEPVTWRPRAWNIQADFVVNEVMDSDTDHSWTDEALMQKASKSTILIFSDGGLRRPTMKAAAGFVAYIAVGGAFEKLASRAQSLVGMSSAFATELLALEMGVEFMASVV
jgi:hypothetical protein